MDELTKQLPQEVQEGFIRWNDNCSITYNRVKIYANSIIMFTNDSSNDRRLSRNSFENFPNSECIYSDVYVTGKLSDTNTINLNINNYLKDKTLYLKLYEYNSGTYRFAKTRTIYTVKLTANYV